MFNTQNLWATLHRWTWAISHSMMLIDHSWQVGWHCQHGSLAQDSSRFADHALHGLWGRHHLLLSRLGNIGMQLRGGGTQLGNFSPVTLASTSFFLRKKRTSKLDFPYLDCSMISMSRWGRLHCLQSSRSRWVGGGVEFPIATRTLFFVLGCFGLLAVFGCCSSRTAKVRASPLSFYQCRRILRHSKIWCDRMSLDQGHGVNFLFREKPMLTIHRLLKGMWSVEFGVQVLCLWSLWWFGLLRIFCDEFNKAQYMNITEYWMIW